MRKQFCDRFFGLEIFNQPSFHIHSYDFIWSSLIDGDYTVCKQIIINPGEFSGPLSLFKKVFQKPSLRIELKKLFFIKAKNIAVRRDFDILGTLKIESPLIICDSHFFCQPDNMARLFV